MESLKAPGTGEVGLKLSRKGFALRNFPRSPLLYAPWGDDRRLFQNLYDSTHINPDGKYILRTEYKPCSVDDKNYRHTQPDSNVRR
jgi:hypothetical protein